MISYPLLIAEATYWGEVQCREHVCSLANLSPARQSINNYDCNIILDIGAQSP
jgi:hypothetical protein